MARDAVFKSAAGAGGFRLILSRERGIVDATTSSDAPEVVVLLLNWCGWKDTIECLESVFRQDYANYSVIVCDNASNDGSLEHIRRWAEGDLLADGSDSGSASGRPGGAPVRKPIPALELDRAQAESAGAGEAPLVLIQTGGNLGFAGGNNVGLRYVLGRGTARYIWLLNNDTIVDPLALRRMVDRAEADSTIGMVGSKLLDYESPSTIQTVGGGTVTPWRGLTDHIGAGEVDAGQWEQPFAPDYITGASLLVRADLVRTVGEMDEGYFLYSEEVDWCLRAKRQDWRMAYAPGSVVWHKGGRSVGYQSAIHDYNTVRSMLLLVRKFYPHLLPVTFAYSLFRCLAPKVVRLQPGRFMAVMRAYRDFFARRPARRSEGRRAAL